MMVTKMYNDSHYLPQISLPFHLYNLQALSSTLAALVRYSLRPSGYLNSIHISYGIEDVTDLILLPIKVHSR